MVDTETLRMAARAHDEYSQPSTAALLREAAGEIDRLRVRLEINDKAQGWDGIACRDVTISEQDKLIDRLREIVEMAAAGNTEYDVLQQQAQAALAQEQGVGDGHA